MARLAGRLLGALGLDRLSRALARGGKRGGAGASGDPHWRAWKWYRLEPGPFELLTEKERDKLEEGFLQLLHTVDRGVIVVQSSTQEYSYEGEKYEVLYNRFYLATQRELTELTPTEPPPRPRIARILPDHLVLEDGRLAQSAVFYKYPDILPEGFLYEYFGLGDIVIRFEALDPVAAAQSVDAARKRLEGLGAADSFSIRKLQKVRELQVLIGGQAKLLRFWVWITYYGRTREELRRKYNRIREIARSRLLDVDVPVFYQHALYNYRAEVNSFIPFMNSVTPKYIDSITASWALYPLISEDLVDEDGVFLGFSGSGSPILFNPFHRHNHNIVILGESGSGKSMTAKILLKRMREKYGIKVWGVDPENEYVKVSHVLGLKPIVVRRGMTLGLDPFKLSRIVTPDGRLIEVEDIAELLAEFYLPDDLALRNRLRSYVTDFYDSVESIFEFVDIVAREDEKLYNYLKPINAPPDSYVYDGDPPQATENVVFGLREITGSGATRLKALITTLISLIYQREAFKGTSAGFVFIDEAWLFVRYNITMMMLENLARRARKYRKGLIFITQRPYDVAANEAGRTILEQSATVLLLRQNEAGAKMLMELYNIREPEAAELIKAEPGHGILRTGNYLLRVYVQPSREEYELFKTTGEWLQAHSPA